MDNVGKAHDINLNAHMVWVESAHALMLQSFETFGC